MDELKSTTDVQEWLTSQAHLSWITSSALHLRAFYWGLYSGLGLNEDERGRDSVLVSMMAHTCHARPADDPFRLTELYTHVERLYDQLGQRIETSRGETGNDQDVAEPDGDDDRTAQPIEVLFKPLLDCIQSLDEQRAQHREFIRRGLEQAASEGGGRPTETEERLLQALDSLDGSFRILALGDSD